MRYKIIDTLSESTMLLTPTQLESIFSSSTMQVANATTHNNKIKVSDWVHNIATRRISEYNEGHIDNTETNKKCPLVLLAKKGGNYNITDYSGDIEKISFYDLKECITKRKVANCNPIDNTDSHKIIGIDTYEIVANATFEKEIALKYELFIAKSLLLGYGNVAFNYEIENKQVKLKKYTGSSNSIILPSFITAIMERAFGDANIEAINLNEGLKVIGSGAFQPKGLSNGLRNVEIPSTVELIGSSAFSGCTKLVNYDRTLNMDRVKLRNSATIITR